MVRRGFFELQTPENLLRKLEWDYTQLQQDHENVNFAYNFFVTVENMPEWVKNKAFKHAIQQQELILTICNDLATGPKHVTLNKQKPAVASAAREGWVKPGWVKRDGVAAPLIVRLSPEQAAKRGQEAIDVLTLAGEVLTFWQQYVRRGPA